MSDNDTAAFATSLQCKCEEFIASGEGTLIDRRRAKRLQRFLKQPDSEEKQRKLRRMQRHAVAAVEDGVAEKEFALPVGAMTPVGISWDTVFTILRVFLSILGLILIFI